MNQDLLLKKKEIVNFFLKKNILVSADFLTKLDSCSTVSEMDAFKELSSELLILNPDIDTNSSKNSDINWKELEKSRVFHEKGKSSVTYNKFLDIIKSDELSSSNQINATKDVLDVEGLNNNLTENSNVKVLFSYDEPSKKRTVQDFVGFFNQRHKKIESFLKHRKELQNLSSINRILQKKDKDTVSIVAMITDKQISKNNNIILTVEDPTGFIKVVVNKNKPEMFELVNNSVLDEVIGVVGVNNGNVIFANEIIVPDIPINQELKKSPDETYAVFISDLHFGSKLFLKEEFDKFINWINGAVGNSEQKDIASKIKYLFIAGDLVEGVGIFPGQEDELEIMDIYQQYEELSKLFERFPKNIQIIVCPGNHDAMRIAEPQPPIYKDFAKALWDMPNITLVSNPSLVNIHSSDGFSGFNVLMYHGYSFPYLSDNVLAIRSSGGLTRADLLMKFVLQRRHLAPPHTSNLSIPDMNSDPLVIDKIPDFFVTGHIHRTTVSSYRSVTLLNCSCWVSQSDEQARRGIVPEPARVIIVNLQTRQVKILKFGAK